MTIKTTIVILLSLAVLAGCGRRGEPLTPSQAAREQAKKDAKESTSGTQAAPEEKKEEDNKPDRPFILDGLLE